MKLRSVTPLAIFGCALLTIFFSFYGDDSYTRMRSLNKSLDAQRKINAELKELVGQLRNRVYGIEQDDRVLEKAARNELGLARPGELVFIFEKQEAGDKRATVERAAAAKKSSRGSREAAKRSGAKI